MVGQRRIRPLNNVVHYMLFDTAVNGWLIEASGRDIRELPAIGIVAETSCRFLREISYPDVVSVGIRLERRGHSSVIYQLGIFKEIAGGGGLDPTPHAVGRFVHVYVDSVTRSPVEIPEAIAAALDVLT
jgi:acyl-CoA thioester hydrolase